MGIDLKAGGRIKKKNKTQLKSPNVYLKLLVKLFRFLARRTDSKFSKTVLKRLLSSNVNRPPVSLSRIAKNLKGNENATFVCIATITNDDRILEIPSKLKICALKFTETARARIIKAGGECLTLDQLVVSNPEGKNTFLMRGPRSREALKHFGVAPGIPGSHTAPYAESKTRRERERPTRAKGKHGGFC